MNLTGTHGLICLGADEYSAITLAERHNAVAIDAAVQASNSALSGYNNRPYVRASLSANTSSISQSLSEWVPGSSLPGLNIFDGSFAITRISSPGITFASPLNVSSVWRQGWWLVGGWITYQCVGAVTNLSRRTLGVQWRHSVNGVSQYEANLNTSYESNTGTDAMTVQGMFYADGIHSYNADLVFAHRNAGSSMIVNAGARLWMFYLGSGVAS